ncbi:MAG: polysaccharide deacetylase family protein, partial [Alphaproteobacteria bacterium]|nr:polysaccharide deacetylase family protein [Alphaproteobacteria bacterium]
MNDSDWRRAPWPGGARIALSLVVNVEEGAEARIDDGDPWPEPVDELSASPRRAIRNYGNESNYAYGIKAGAPRVMRLLEERRLKATFTAAAVALERASTLATQIVAGGHEVCAHGHRWIHQFRMDEAQERAFIQDAAASIERTTGTRPIGWLSRYLLTPNTRRLLIEEGFT